MRSSLLVVLLATACNHAPTGALGARWGDDLAKLHVTCTATMADPPFDDCEIGKVAHLDRHPQTTVVLEHHALAGVRFHFEGDECHHAKLQAAIGDAYHVEYTTGSPASPYTVFGDDELVYFSDCTLVVAGSHYGKFFVDRLLREGWGELVRAFQVH